MVDKPTYEELEQKVQELERTTYAYSHAKEELWKKNTLLQSLVQSPMTINIACLDTAYCYLFFNNVHKDAVQSAWNVTVETGSNLLDYIVGRNDRTIAKRIFDRALAGETFTLIQEFGNIERRAWESIYSPISGSDGQICGLSVYSIDITELKKAEHTIQESEERLQSFMDSATDGFILFDSELNHIEMNKAALEIMGFKRKDVIGKNLIDTVPNIKGTDRYAEYKKVIKTGVPFHIRDITNHPLTGDRHIEIKAFKVGNGLGMIFNDITTQRSAEKLLKKKFDLNKAENEKIKLKFQLQQAQKMETIGTLAGGIAHDFNNILSSILGFATLVKQDLIEHDSELKSNIDQVIIAGHRATDLVQHILTFSRHSEIDKQPLRVSLLIKEAIKFLRASLPASIEIKTNIRDKDATILADATQVHQVVMNLCTNATHAMKKEGGVLTICLEKKTLTVMDILEQETINPGDYLKLSIFDTGHGIPDEFINRVFDPFFTTKKKGEGTGMGLSVVHGIIKDMGGTITVESEPGKGSVFHVMIPTHKTIPAHDKIAHDEMIQKGEGHVLYVDDENAILRYADTMLQRAGYKVTTVNNSLEALVLFESGPKGFDIVITDLDMPKMDGLEFSKRILKERPGIPIILITGFSRKITREDLYKIGIHKMIMKPVIVSELIETINSAIKLDQ